MTKRLRPSIKILIHATDDSLPIRKFAIAPDLPSIASMKNLPAAIVLIGAGLVIIYFGHRREDSIAGASEKIGKDFANAFDGKARQPGHIWYYIGGGSLIAAGLFTALRKSAS